MLNGFEGELTQSKWAQLANCSQDTALRDILARLAHGALAKDPADGRSTSYSVTNTESPRS
jgi:Fic family protein